MNPEAGEKIDKERKDLKKKRETVYLIWLCNVSKGTTSLECIIWGLNSDRTKENFPVINFLEVHFIPELVTATQHIDF